MNWRYIRRIAIGRLIFCPIYAILGVGLLAASNNAAAVVVAALLVAIAVAGFVQAVLDVRRTR